MIVVHAGIAQATGLPFWALAPQEAKGIGIAIKDASKHFDIRASQKVIDLLSLTSTLGFVYGPRIITTAMVLRQRRNPPPTPAQTNGVVPSLRPEPIPTEAPFN